MFGRTPFRMNLTDALGDLGEEAMLEYFARLPRGGKTQVGPGDDCAVVAGPPGGYDLLLKTDALVESVHFAAETPPGLVGRKALARVVSDFAAMGGRPDHFLVTMALRSDTPWAWVKALYDGMLAAAEGWDTSLAGGETTRMPGGGANVISVAATGHVERGRAVLRGGGRAGDVLAVTGRLGDSLASGRHLSFVPRVEEAAWLVEHGPPSAMMDLSDGLAKDLPRLAAASGCGFAVDFDALPLHVGADVGQAVGDGEDYELLMAVDPERWKLLAGGWAGAFPEVPLTVIGRLVEIGDAAAIPFAAGGWDHFRNGRAQW